MTAVKPGALKPPRPRRRTGGPWGFLPLHEPDDLVGGRRLEGEEFARRKAELEARDRAERAAAERAV